MFKTNLKLAFRNLWRYKTYSCINIGGLAIAMGCFITMLLYVNHELSYDRWNAALKQVYRVGLKWNGDVEQRTSVLTTGFLQSHFQEVAAATKLLSDGDGEDLLIVGQKHIYQDGVVMADSAFFSVFPYRFVQGNPETAMLSPDALVVSDAVANKLFPGVSAMGQVVKIESNDYVVSGVVHVPEGPSHLNMKMVAQLPGYARRPGKGSNHWGARSFVTYFRSTRPMGDNALENLINPVFYAARYAGDAKAISYAENVKQGMRNGLIIESVEHIHTHPKVGSSNFNITVILFSLALLLLVVAVINYANLSVAQSFKRAKEVGIRKLLGSMRPTIILQFFSESFLQCLIALLLSLAIVEFLLPVFNHTFSLSLSLFSKSFSGKLVVQLVALLVLIAFLSSIYPVLFLSGFRINKVLKGDISRGHGGRNIRQALIVTQFVITGLFMAGIGIIALQVRYMKNKDLGYNLTQVMRISHHDFGLYSSRFEQGIHDPLMRVPGVVSVAKATTLPGGSLSDTSSFAFAYKGTTLRMSAVKVSYDFLSLLGIPVVAGRTFDRQHTVDTVNSAVVNEAAARLLGANAVGQLVNLEQCADYRITGVVKDVNVLGFEAGVQPTFYYMATKPCWFQEGGDLIVKIKTADIAHTLAGITAAWRDIEPDYPIQYSFLSDDFAQVYQKYVRMERIVFVFGIISFIIALVGLFALASFTTEQRTKEISIRKILGAGTGEILQLLNRDFVRMVGMACVVILPMAYWMGRTWLNGFADRINVPVLVFAGVVAALVLVTVLTVSARAWKTIRKSPVEALKYE